ncbi:MAG: hypothetical protein AAB874_02900, partial [Patescibacteria group bacterium]
MKLVKNSVLICNLIFVICNYFLAAPSAHAESFHLSINPPIAQIVIKPGKTITNIFTIKNLDTLPQTLTARIIPFTSGDDWGNPHLLPSYNPDWLKYFSLANSNITLNQPFVIESNTSQQLVLSITVPLDAPLVDHYATLLITQTVDSSNQSQITRLSGSIGANILLSVSSTDQPSSSIAISEFTVSPSPLIKINATTFLYDNLDPLFFKAKAKNPNRHLVQVKSTIKISSRNSIQSFQALLPTYLLAGTDRYLNASDSSYLSYTPTLTN